MDWSKGYTASYYMTLIDPYTWQDIERIELTGGSIARSTTDLRQSASLDCTEYSSNIEQWVRVYMDTEQGGSSEHIALFTGLATSPGRKINGLLETHNLECYSVLKAVDDVNLLRGWYAPQGISGGSVIKDLLDVGFAPVEIAENSPLLSSNIVAGDDDTHLTMIDKILVAISGDEEWVLDISGDGTIYVGPIDRTPVVNFDPINNDVVESKIDISGDYFSCPNVFMAINDDIVAIARDENENSMLSIPNRGREVWMRESGCELADNETTEQYALRRLYEEQRVWMTASYDRRFMPGVSTNSYIYMHYPEQKIDGIFRVTSQNIELSHAARTSEVVETEV